MTMQQMFVFPGQGSQHVGMGAEFMEHPVTQPVFQEADEILGFALSHLMKEGPLEELTLTQHAQPALFVSSMAAFVYVMQQSGQPLHQLVRALAGHSVGEFAAACAAGCMSFSEALKLVKLRGEAMAAAVPPGEGAMAAVLGLNLHEVTIACEGEGAFVANDNCVGQAVITGPQGAVDEASNTLVMQGAKKVMRLEVSGPFHSPMMQPAAETLAEALAGIVLQAPVLPLVMVADAKVAETADQVKNNLIAQTTQTVRWREVMATAAEQGVETVVELGAGNVLTKLAKRAEPALQGVALNTPAACDAFLAEQVSQAA